MHQVNILPLDILPSADISTDKASYPSRSPREPGYKKETHDHFSGLVDKHLEDKKNENRRKSTRAKNRGDHSSNNSGNKLSEKNAINNFESKDKKTPAIKVSKDPVEGDKKRVSEDTHVKRTTAKKNVSSEDVDEKSKGESTDTVKIQTREEVLEQSHGFLSLLNSSAKILQPKVNVDNAKTEASSNAKGGGSKSTEETLVAMLAKSSKAASDDSAGDSEIGTEPESKVNGSATPEDKHLDRSVKSISSDVGKQVGSEHSNGDKSLAAGGNKALFNVDNKSNNNNEDTEMSQTKKLPESLDKETKETDSVKTNRPKSTGIAASERQNVVKAKDKLIAQVRAETDIKNNNGAAELTNVGSRSTNKEVDFNPSLVINANKKEADSSNISKARTSLPSAAQEVMNSSDNSVLDKGDSVTLEGGAADNENSAKQQGRQAGTQQNNANSNTQQANQEVVVKLASETEDKISNAELDNVSAQKAAENDIVNNTLSSLGNNEGSKTSNAFTDVVSQATQATVKAYEHAEALVAEAEALTIEKVEQNKNNVQALNETISIFRKDFADAVKDKIMVIISKKLQQFDIKLDPPELGSVHVKVNLQNEQAVVNFTVQNQSAKEAFEQSLDRLKDMLAEHGVDVGDANVEQQSAQHSENNFEQGKNTDKEDLKGDLLAENVEGQTVMPGDFIDSSAARVDYYA